MGKAELPTVSEEVEWKHVGPEVYEERQSTPMSEQEIEDKLAYEQFLAEADSGNELELKWEHADSEYDNSQSGPV